MLLRFSTRRQQNAQSLMQELYQTPVIRINAVTELLGVPHNAAAALVRDFVAHCVLRELSEKRGIAFTGLEIIYLFLWAMATKDR